MTQQHVSRLCWAALATAWLLAGAQFAAAADSELRSGDAYLRSTASSWTLGTAGVEKVIALEDGRLVLKSLRHKQSGRELVPSATPIVELSPELVGAEKNLPWQLESATPSKLGQGELQLELKLSAGPLVVCRTYVVYPETSVIRQWHTCRNAGTSPLKLVDPQFFGITAKLGAGLETLDFHWMTGARNEPGCWTLKTRQITPERSQRFDSYDPFPGLGGHSTRGDGVDVKVLHNGKQVWPATGWQYCKGDADERVELDLKLDVAAGDRLAFVVNRHGEIGYDTTEFDPQIAYEGAAAHRASREFAGQQGISGWRYGYFEKDQWHDLSYDAQNKRWVPQPDNPTHTPFVMAGLLHPGTGQDAARQWTASTAGQVRLTASVSNVGDQGLGIPFTAHTMGSESYAPWYAMVDRQTGDGLVIGWDYMGHWKSCFAAADAGAVKGSLQLAGYRQTLQPGEMMTSPKAMLALWHGDLDNAGNELLDWQYRYLWDYTRPGYFPAIPMLGYWFKGTNWGQPGVPWWGSNNPDIASQFTKIFRTADLLRYVGGDLYHRDWGWWDRAGDWNGPDFGVSGKYLRKYGMGQVIYAFLYTINAESKLAKEHPDWLLGETLDLSKPEVVANIKRQLDDFHRRWGDFAWRNDSTPTAPRKGDDTVLLAQDQAFRGIIQYFLDKYPKSSFQSVNGGGNEAGYDYVRLSGMFQFSDGVIGPLRNYYASLLLPPDKLMDNGDEWNPDKYEKARWRSLLSMAIMSTGDTWNRSALEGVREVFDLYHYLAARGVVGRWVKIYRPRVEGHDPTMYIQRLSRDRLRGIIVPGRTAPGKVTLWPKGLLPETTYSVTFQESPAEQERSGRDLMEKGIVIEKMAAGELIYFNLPMHPGSPRDREPPTPPREVVKQRAENMGFPGVEVAWQPATDNNWISYYEIVRSGQAIDKVAKGTFYFDHSAGADLAARYEVRAVDGAKNASTPAAAVGASAKASQVVDDAAATVKYTGAWRHEQGLQPAYCETIASADAKDAAVEVVVQGRRLLWFAKLGDDCGKASVTVDDGPAEIVDTYCSDDIWGSCVWRKELPSDGPHTVRIVLTGQHNPRSKADRVYFDGIRGEAE